MIQYRRYFIQINDLPRKTKYVRKQQKEFPTNKKLAQDNVGKS